MMNRHEGEYCALLLCVGGPPAPRPIRDRRAGYVEWEPLNQQEIDAWRAWATKVQDALIEWDWPVDDPDRALFNWITEFLDWFDSMTEQAEGRERYHRAGHRYG